MSLPAQIGRNVKRLRLEAGWSQEKLSAESGISTVYISQLEAGQRNTTIQTLQSIASALKIKVADLLSEAAQEARRGLPRGRGAGRKAPRD